MLSRTVTLPQWQSGDVPKWARWGVVVTNVVFPSTVVVQVFDRGPDACLVWAKAATAAVTSPDPLAPVPSACCQWYPDDPGSEPPVSFAIIGRDGAELFLDTSGVVDEADFDLFHKYYGLALAARTARNEAGYYLNTAECYRQLFYLAQKAGRANEDVPADARGFRPLERELIRYAHKMDALRYAVGN